MRQRRDGWTEEVVVVVVVVVVDEGWREDGAIYGESAVGGLEKISAVCLLTL
jgi:hypothetical protein